MLRTRTAAPTARWLLLFHRLPAQPHYFRVDVGRRLRRLGALALKNSVYAMPASDERREALTALVRAIAGRGGEAVVVEARLVAGLDDEGLLERFRRAREAEYRAIGAAARAVLRPPRASAGRAAGAEARRRALARAVERLRARIEALAARDGFGAASREAAVQAISLAEDRLAGIEEREDAQAVATPPRGAMWVTRAGVMIDRIASAWLIRRFVDAEARFRFVPGRIGARPGTLRFDMAGAEFTHEGGRCTFEVLAARFAPDDAALRAIGEMIHDLDLEESRFARPETRGLGRTLVGITLATRVDSERLERGGAVLDALYRSFGEPEAGGKTGLRRLERKRRPRGRAR